MADTRTVTMRGLKKCIRRCVESKRPAMIWGPPGIGKSDGIKQMCDEMGGILYDIRLSLLEPTDLRGVPYYNKESGKMEWAPPVDLPDEETASKYPVVFVLFDEINSAAPSVQAACYQIALNRKVGTYKLPDNAVIIAAGNREGDRGVTYRMPAPLSNRFIHFELRVDFDSWNEWATQNMIHRDVVGFLNFSKNHLYDFDPKSNSRSFATPRSWEFVSQILDDQLDDVTLTDIISGTVGEGLALNFMTHRKVVGRLPRPSDILKGKVDKLEVKEISAHYSLATSCCYELKDWLENKKDMNEWHEMTNNFLSFLLDFAGPEVIVMAIRTAVQVHKLPFKTSKMARWSEFNQKFGKLIMAAN